jgi:hypothetical protein
MKNCTGEWHRSPESTALAQSSLLGDEPRRIFPSAGGDTTTNSPAGEAGEIQALICHRSSRIQTDQNISDPSSPCLSVANTSGLGERDFFGIALLGFNRAADFQQLVEHFGAFSAAGGELGVGLFMRLLQPVKLVSDMKGRQNSDFQ